MPVFACCCDGGGSGTGPCYYQAIKCVDTLSAPVYFTCTDYPLGVFILDESAFGCMYVDTSTTYTTASHIYSPADTSPVADCADTACQGCSPCCATLRMGFSFLDGTGEFVWHPKFPCVSGTYDEDDISADGYQFHFAITIDDVAGTCTVTVDVTNGGTPEGSAIWTFPTVCLADATAGTLATNTTAFSPAILYISCCKGTDDPQNYPGPLTVSGYSHTITYPDQSYVSVPFGGLAFDDTLRAAVASRDATCPDPVTFLWGSYVVNFGPPYTGGYSQDPSYTLQADGTYELDTILLQQTGAPVSVCDYSSPAWSAWFFHCRAAGYINPGFAATGTYWFNSEWVQGGGGFTLAAGGTSHKRNATGVLFPNGATGTAAFPLSITVS